MAEVRLELRGDEVWLRPDCLPDEYARLCDPLVRDGLVSHDVEVPADDFELLDRRYGLVGR